MRNITTILLSLLPITLLVGQSALIEGQVSYVSSRNIYVQFESTALIEIGDTLYLKEGNGAVVIPCLVVTAKSSISCVTSRISGFDGHLEKSDPIVARDRTMIESPAPEPIPEQDIRLPETGLPPDESGAEVIPLETDLPDPEPAFEERIRGRLSASLFSNFTSASDRSTARMRYNFSMRADHIRNSKFSVEGFMSYRHRLDERGIGGETETTLADHLKIYNLAVRYHFNASSQISVGRKVNNRLANMGSLDGIQFEQRFNNLTVGAFGGLRPDYEDFGLNTHLVQGGAFISLDGRLNAKNVRTTVAIAEQKNAGKTDRRFAYFQHNSSPLKDLFLFASFEVDLFENINDQPRTAFNMLGAYLSLRYRASGKLSLFASYDARRNVIYYESYKSFIEQLIDQETRQGFRARVNFRPFKYVSTGVSAGYRMQKDQPEDSKNLRTFVTYSRIPWIKVSATADFSWLQSGYLEGRIFGFRMRKDLIRGKLSGEGYYRRVDYTFLSTESTLTQNIVGLNLHWRILNRLSLSVIYEGTFEEGKQTDRIRLNLSKRFR